MTESEKAALLEKLSHLEWTEEKQPQHPWKGDILVRRKDVERIIEEAGP